MANFIRYSTNDPTEIMLLKYGFTFEDVEWLMPDFIKSATTEEIKFKNTERLSQEQRDRISRFNYSDAAQEDEDVSE